MILQGEELWDALGSILGSTIMNLFRYTLYPIILTPTYFNPNDFRRGSKSVDTNITFGTGENGSSVKFKDTTLTSKLKEVVEKVRTLFWN